jgi:DNA-binding MarR family transcriptional regulator
MPSQEYISNPPTGPNRSGGWLESYFPSRAYRDRRLRNSTYRLLFLLGAYLPHDEDTVTCSPSVKELADELNMEEAAVKRGLKRLAQLGYIVIDGGKGEERYTILFDEEAAEGVGHENHR